MNQIMNKWKKLSMCALAAGMTLSLLIVGASAAKDVAQIGEATYTTLADAIKAAGDGDTITLLDDISLGSPVLLSKDLTFDLNGYTLSATGNGQLNWKESRNIVIQNGSLSGMGNIVQMETGALYLENLSSSGGAFSFNLKGGNATLSNCSFLDNSYVLLNICGANVTVTGNSCLTVTPGSGSVNGAAYVTWGSLAVEDSVIEGGTAIYVSGSNAKVYLNSGAEINTTNSNDGKAVILANGTLYMNEGASLGAMVYPIDERGGKVVLPVGKTLENQGGRYVLGDCPHEYEGPEHTPPSCTQEGMDVWTCVKCGKTRTDIFEKLPHTEVTDQAKEATCTTEGKTEGKHCSVCNTVLVAQETIPAGHAWGMWTETKPAGCTKPGEKVHSCVRCDTKETQEIEAKGHTEAIDKAVEATCISEGKTEGKHCSVCNMVLLAQKTVPMKEHAPTTEWSFDGTNHWHECAACGTHLEEAAHTEDGGVVTTEATSTANGTRTYSCTVCGKVLRTETIPAVGGGGSNGGGSIGGGTPGGGAEELPDNDTPLTEDPEEGEDLEEGDVPLGEKPFFFEDVGEKRWFYPAVKYVFDRGLMSGVNATRFDPSANATWGMVVTVLYRMENAPVSEAQDGIFTDLKAGKWYNDAVLWAADSGVVNGYSNGAFGPEDNVTREQLVAILYRYAQYKGYDVSARGDLSSFGDQNKVAKYAREAMEWAVGIELISGVTETSLEPKGNATRAQIATVLMNFDRFVAESQTGTQDK